MHGDKQLEVRIELTLNFDGDHSRTRFVMKFPPLTLATEEDNIPI